MTDEPNNTTAQPDKVPDGAPDQPVASPGDEHIASAADRDTPLANGPPDRSGEGGPWGPEADAPGEEGSVDAGADGPRPAEPETAETEGSEVEAADEPDRGEEPSAPQAESPESGDAQGDVSESPEPETAKPASRKEPKSKNMDWYILKVQSNREDSIRDGLLRRVAIAGLDRYFGEVIVPAEKVTEFKGGKKRILKRKLWPGYLVVQMEVNDDTWFLVRETPGIGDFTGAAGEPTPMHPHEVARIVATQKEKTDEKAPKLKIGFRPGDQVKINEGTFENFEGEVEAIDEANGRVTVMINIFGRSTPVELEYWQVEAV